MIEIGPEAPFLNGGFEIPVGRYDQPDVHGDFLDAADAKEARAIQHAEQFHLEPCVQLAILVEKQSSAIRHFEPTRLGGVGAAEGALFVAEQLALQQILRQRGAVYVHPRLRRARGEMMDRSRDDFFSRPAFAGDQHRGAGGGDLLAIARRRRMASLPKMAVAPKNSQRSKSSLKPYCERLGARKPFGIHMGILAVKT